MTCAATFPSTPNAADRTGRVRRKLLVDGRRIIVAAPGDVTAATVVRSLGGAWAGPDRLLADVSNGVLETSCTGKGTREWSLVVAAGPDMLQSHSLRPGSSVVIGRRSSSTETDPPGVWTIDDGTLSARHAEFLALADSLDVRDLGSRNGTHVSHDRECKETTVRLGTTTVVCRFIEHEAVQPVGAYDFDPSTGTWLTHRSAAGYTPPPPLDVPVARPGTRIRLRVRPGAILGPLVAGLAMALLLDPRLAVFALLSPVFMVVNVLDDRRAASRERRTGERDFASAFDAFVVRLTTAEREWTAKRCVDFPDASRLLTAAAGAGSRIWRRGEGDGLGWQVRLGVGPVRFRPPLSTAGPVPDAVAELLDSLVVPEAAITVDVGPREVVVVVGQRSRDVARALIVSLVTGFGPSSLAILTDDVPGESQQEWRRWLPHPVDVDAAPHTVFVQFVGGGVTGAANRRHFRDSCRDGAVIVVVDRLEQVPSDATTVVHMGGGPLATVQRSVGGESTDVIADGASARGLERVATLLSRWSEATMPSSSLPASLPFDDLLADLDSDLPASRSSASLVAPMGTDGRRCFDIDLVVDGPHALVAGTTGSGKSELLRTMVAGLAARYPPDLVTFVLIDYKGGSAFAECASLPHTVGFVTDLDAGLAARALTCLEAELRRRESVLRGTGDRDLVSYAARVGHEPMPRLLVVIDELAALVRDLPNFVPSLVSLAQRGRTLGLHLVLATQRPAGTVTDAIRANTNIRIALRVQDPTDSVDVIGHPDAAFLDRRCPGRALVRFGPGDVTAVQIAAVGLDAMRMVTTVFDFDGRELVRFPRPADSVPDETTPLARRVSLITQVHRLAGSAPPRQPWPEALPPLLIRPWSDAASIGLADEAAAQWQGEYVPDLSTGGIAVVGSLGSGVTTTLRAIVCALASSSAHRTTQIYVLDLLGRELEPLTAFPRVGAVIGGHEEERRERLVARLGAEVAIRREVASAAEGFAPIVVVIDGWSALRTPGGDIAMLTLGDSLVRLIVEGAALGIRFVIGTDRATSLPNAIAPSIATRIVLCPADTTEAAAAGVRFSPLAVGVPGRALIGGRPGVEVQIWQTDDHAVALSAAVVGEERRAPGVDVLAGDVSLDEVLEADDGSRHGPSPDGSAWVVPIGLGGDTLGVVRVHLRAGEPFLVCGSARSGRSTALATIAAAVKARQSDVEVLPWRRDREVAVLIESVRDACRRGHRVLVTIDDVERIDDPQGQLARLLADDTGSLRIVLAGRADVLRGAYGHWSAAARRSRHGLALRPNPEIDGDLWHTPLPRRLNVRGGPGRGVVLGDGSYSIVQVARVGLREDTGMTR